MRTIYALTALVATALGVAHILEGRDLRGAALLAVAAVHFVAFWLKRK